jgi:hypothetical protein
LPEILVWRETNLAFNFDPDFFSDNLDQKFDQDSYRAGLRYSPLPSSDFLLSFIYSDLKNDVEDSDDFASSRGRTKDESTQTEAQYIYRQDLFNITASFGYSDVNRNLDTNIDLGGVPFLDQLNKQQITEAIGYHLQAETRGRSCRVASSGSLRSLAPGVLETGSH